ncbi:type II toxin-antitoxin system VapC family toxin [Candidatus Micrarchaeota archaeon]|nr:type II toxin-antitoxin system VapC family toxin [Candidatus Micrarchaeota archaeon]
MTLLVDSWAWLEVFKKGPKATLVTQQLKKSESVFVSAVSVFEVGRCMQRDLGDSSRMECMHVLLQKARVLPLTLEDSFTAFHVCKQHAFHATDALIYATAVNHDCQLLTGDPHFKGKLGVIYVGD